MPVATKGLGRIAHFDPTNLSYLVKDNPPARKVGMLRAIARAMGVRDTRSWRQWMYFYQGTMPACTAFGSATYLATDPVRPALDYLRNLDCVALYRAIQTQDRSEGRYYSGGATTLAAMKVGQARGWWRGYQWVYDMDTLLRTLHDSKPVIMGTNYYESQFDRDAEGIARITPATRLAGGHFYVLRGYNPRKGLVTSPQTWNDGDYKYPVDDIARLLGEDGECVVPDEIRPQQ